MAWTPERVEELKKLWADGLSASQIAARLGEVTRNAVIGKVHRLGLSGRMTRSRVKSVRPRKKVMRTKRIMKGGSKFGTGPGTVEYTQFSGQYLDPSAFEVPDELVIPINERKTISTLTESCCRWPIGDPQSEEFHFCGKSKTVAGPYCEFHARKAFQQAAPRKRTQDLIRDARKVAG
ncbi:MAG: GcrA family cell cycle regulator [Pseudomonadota bacterium]